MQRAAPGNVSRVPNTQSTRGLRRGAPRERVSLFRGDETRPPRIEIAGTAQDFFLPRLFGTWIGLLHALEDRPRERCSFFQRESQRRVQELI